MEFSLFPITVMITWTFWELSVVSKVSKCHWLACPIAVSGEAHKFILTSLASSLHVDDGYLGSMF